MDISEALQLLVDVLTGVKAVLTPAEGEVVKEAIDQHFAPPPAPAPEPAPEPEPVPAAPAPPAPVPAAEAAPEVGGTESQPEVV
jgi:hypothetical protein